MEVFRGSLEDISRPASTEQTGSRVSTVSLPHMERVIASTSFSLVVLSNDAADIQTPSSSGGSAVTLSARDPDEDQWQVADGEKEESQLQRAYEEMRRLDEILIKKMSKLRETRRQTKELQAKLWQDLLHNKPEGHFECAYEALNTRLFLALETPTDGTEEEDDFEPVFATQEPECEHSRDQNSEQRGRRPDSFTEAFEVGHEEAGEEQFGGSHCGAFNGKKKQKDFVKRNIEVVSAELEWSLLTQAERERLAELLREIDEEEEDSARGAGSEGQGPEVGWKCDEDQQLGEKVLQDIKAKRGLERRLGEIQQQLENLGRGQEMTNEPPDLTEEQLLSLLHECELTDSCIQDLETCDTTL